MGYKKQWFKNGKLVKEVDTRVLSEEVADKKEEVNRYLGEHLAKSDWAVVRDMDPSSSKKMNKELQADRKKARELAEKLEAELDAAKHLDDLDKFNPKIEDLM